MIASIRRTVPSADRGGGHLLEFPALRIVGQLHVGAELDREHVAVEAGQVEQGPVERVPLQPGRPGLLPVLEFLQRTGPAADGGRDPLAGRAFAERPAQGLAFGHVELFGQRRGFASAALTSFAAAASA